MVFSVDCFFPFCFVSCSFGCFLSWISGVLFSNRVFVLGRPVEICSLLCIFSIDVFSLFLLFSSNCF